MRVVATAGHVDHGKSTLVEALTGIDPDRLEEEKARQMTIDLGFAWMTLPSGEGVGFVDVPGHRDFIENMLAGVGATNAAILVIAADEGLMPQTREHLAILDLLEVPALVVALTKSDLIEDPEWFELLRAEITRALDATRYAGAEMIEVSATKRTGLDQLVAAVERALADAPGPVAYNSPRLPVDRAFTIGGFGTVVTGTLVDGSFRVGEDVIVLPGRTEGRIRGLQTHRQPVDQAIPYSRVAMNLSGISVDQVQRGDVIVQSGSERGTMLVDAKLELLAEAPATIEHNAQVKLFVGAAQRMATVRLLDDNRLAPGDSGWARLLIAEPVAVRRGDRLILRRPSPPATLGGGQVADPHPPRRYRKHDQRRLEALQALLGGSDLDALLQALIDADGQPLAAAADFAGLELQAAAERVSQAVRAGNLVVLNPDRPQGEWRVVGTGQLDRLADEAQLLVGDYHRRFPKRGGMPRQELRSRLGLRSSGLIETLAQRGVLRAAGTSVSLPDFEPQISETDRAALGALLARFEANPNRPPSVAECQQAVGDELLAYLISSGELVRVSDSVVFRADQYQRLVAWLTQRLTDQREITVAQFRTEFGTTRKYALALLEHLDLIGLTYREGNYRRLVRRRAEGRASE